MTATDNNQVDDPRAGHFALFPEIGLLGLIVDGANVAQIAAALDTSCANVKAHVYAALDTLSTRAGLAQMPIRSTQVRKLVPGIVQAIANRTSLSWVDLLDDREHLELLETRAYFRAFRNSSVNMKELSHVQV